MRVDEYARHMIDIADRNHAEWEQETISKMLLAEESPGKSKRELLGITGRSKKVGELPLFTSQLKLFQ